MRLLFSAANCLLDPSSGAAISVRTLLRLLAAAGVECRSLTGSIYDRPASASNTENLRDSGAAPTDPAQPLNGLWRFDDGEVTHLIVPLPRPQRALQTRQDEEGMLRHADAVLQDYRPDVLMIYGGGHYERGLVSRARDRGIAVVFYLANPTYKNAENFRLVDLVFTDTAATRDLYRERFGLDPYVIGKFIDRPAVPETAGPARYVTFVNPSPEKGVTLFYRIAELARQVAPQMRFLVVESRATLNDAEKRTGMRFSMLGNVRAVGLQRDMGAVFALTRVLLMPSLCHESGPRTPVEACSLGIPTVATDRGGLPEVLGDAGIFVTPPPPLVANHWLIPPLSSAIPWVEALRQLEEDAGWYAERRQLALAHWPRHDPRERIGDIVRILQQLVAARLLAGQR